MPRAIPFLLLMLVSGCAASAPATPTSGDTMCHALEPLARDHARALADDTSDTALQTGHRLIAGQAAACVWGF